MRLKYAEDFHIRSLLNKVKIQEVMTTPSISIRYEAPLREVAKIFQSHSVRHLPITNDKQEVVGILSQRDLYKIQPPHKNEDGEWVYDSDILDGFILNNVMTHNPFTLKATDVLALAIAPMVKRKYGCVPIVDEKNKLCGIITQYDILKIAYDILQEGKPNT